MKPRRKGYQAFILKSPGMAEYLETNGQKKALMDKNGIVRVRPTKVNRTAEGKCRTYNNGLAAFVVNERWKTTYSKLAAIVKLLERMTKANCKFNPPEKDREKIIEELKKLANTQPEVIKQKFDEYIDKLINKYHKYAYAERLRKEAEDPAKLLEKLKSLMADLGIA